MVTGGNVERGARSEFGERRLAAQLRDGLQQIKRAVDGLDAVAIAVGAAVRPAGLSPRPGDDLCVHGSCLPCAEGESGWPRESSDFPIEEYLFRNMKDARKSQWTLHSFGGLRVLPGPIRFPRPRIPSARAGCAFPGCGRWCRRARAAGGRRAL